MYMSDDQVEFLLLGSESPSFDDLCTVLKAKPDDNVRGLVQMCEVKVALFTWRKSKRSSEMALRIIHRMISDPDYKLRSTVQRTFSGLGLDIYRQLDLGKHYWNKVKHLEPKSESVEQIDEYNSKDGVYKHKGKYGYQGTGAEHGVSDHEKDTDMDDLDYQKKSKKLGARQNMGKRGQSDGTKKKKTNESFTAMLEMYNEHGLKYLAELGRVEEDVLIDETPGQDIQVINADIQNGYAEMTVEEVDNDTFTKEMKDQEAKMNGKKKGGDVAKPSVQAVKQEEVEQIDELSKGTLGRYIKKAHFAGGMADFRHGMKHDKRGDSKDKMALAKTSHKREKGINKAVDRLTKKD